MWPRYAFAMADTTTSATADPHAQLAAIRALESARRAQQKSAAAVQKATAALKGANRAQQDAGRSVAAAFAELTALGVSVGMLRELGITVPPVPTKTGAAASPIGVAAATSPEKEETR